MIFMIEIAAGVALGYSVITKPKQTLLFAMLVGAFLLVLGPLAFGFIWLWAENPDAMKFLGAIALFGIVAVSLGAFGETRPANYFKPDNKKP